MRRVLSRGRSDLRTVRRRRLRTQAPHCSGAAYPCMVSGSVVLTSIAFVQEAPGAGIVLQRRSLSQAELQARLLGGSTLAVALVDKARLAGGACRASSRAEGPPPAGSACRRGPKSSRRGQPASPPTRHTRATAHGYTGRGHPTLPYGSPPTCLSMDG